MVPHAYVEVCRVARLEETHFESSVGGEECLVSGESEVSGDRIGGGTDMDAEEYEGREGAEEEGNHEKSLEERERDGERSYEEYVFCKKKLQIFMSLRSCSVVNGELENFGKEREKIFDFLCGWLFDGEKSNKLQ